MCAYCFNYRSLSQRLYSSLFIFSMMTAANLSSMLLASSREDYYNYPGTAPDNLRIMRFAGEMS